MLRVENKVSHGQMEGWIRGKTMMVLLSLLALGFEICSVKISNMMTVKNSFYLLCHYVPLVDYNAVQIH